MSGRGGGASPSNVGTSNDPSLNEVIASVLRNDVALAVPTVPIASVWPTGQSHMHRASHRVDAATTETRHFREFFGMSLLVVEKTWELLEKDSLLPEGGHPKHLLWALHFMKVYPKQSPGCLAVGASAGAVDPKTHRKWVWAFIDAVANLVDVAVSNHSVRTRAGVIYC